MDNAKIKFYGTNETDSTTLEAFCFNEKEIFIEIDDPHSGNTWITLNKATAVQLVKKLKLEISKIDSHGNR